MNFGKEIKNSIMDKISRINLRFKQKAKTMGLKLIESPKKYPK